jgi:putative transposase
MAKRKRHTEEEIIRILKEATSGVPVADLLRKHNISQGTFYRWKSAYGGMEVNELKRLKELEHENARLKRLVADQALDIVMLKEINSKNW